MQKIPHSIKVPYIYKATSTIVRKVKEERGSLKTLVYNSNKHSNIKGLYALSFKTLEKEDVVNGLIDSSQILVKEKKADPWLVRVLVTELLFGKQSLQGESKPVQVVLSYRDALLAGLEQLGKKATLSSGSSDIQDVTPRWVRVNTLMISVAEALEYFENEGWQLVPSEAINDYRAFLEKASRLAKGQFMVDFHIKELLAFPSKTEFFSHELYLNGSIVLQDKASCLSSWILNPAPGSITLDMCAAPGTKTTHLAALMENKGTLHAIDMNAERYKVLCEMVGKHGAECVQTQNVDTLRLDANSCPGVEYILVDPSCSGSGLISRRQNTYDKARLRKLAMFQFKLLTRALTCFPDVKRVVYSTCSIEPEENEAVVEQVLDFVNRDPEKPNFELADNILEGNWINYGSSDYSVGPKCVYALPDVDLTNGFFVAHFVRVGGAGGHENLDRSKTKKKKKKTKKNEALPKTQDDDNDSLKKIENEESDNESRRCEKKRKRKKKASDESNLEDGGNNRLEVENLDSPKKKKKHHRSETEAEEEMAHLDGKFETQLIVVGERKGQIKKKHKKRKMSI